MEQIQNVEKLRSKWQEQTKGHEWIDTMQGVRNHYLAWLEELVIDLLTEPRIKRLDMWIEFADAIMAEGLGISVDDYVKGIENVPKEKVDHICGLILENEFARAREIYNKYNKK